MKAPSINLKGNSHRVKRHWSVYAFAASTAVALFFLSSIFMMDKLDVYLLLTYIYFSGLFVFFAFLTMPIRPPKHLSAEDQDAYIKEAIEAKFDVLECNKYNIFVLSSLVLIIWILKLL